MRLPLYPSNREARPATAIQLSTITRMAMALRIKSPIEEKPMSMAEAGRIIRELEAELKAKRRKGR